MRSDFIPIDRHLLNCDLWAQSPTSINIPHPSIQPAIATTGRAGSTQHCDEERGDGDGCLFLCLPWWVVAFALASASTFLYACSPAMDTKTTAAAPLRSPTFNHCLLFSLSPVVRLCVRVRRQARKLLTFFSARSVPSPTIHTTPVLRKFASELYLPPAQRSALLLSSCAGGRWMPCVSHRLLGRL